MSFQRRREDPNSERVGGGVTVLGNWAGFYCPAWCPERRGVGEREGGGRGQCGLPRARTVQLGYFNPYIPSSLVSVCCYIFSWAC
jgi:hypothetical protein